MPAPLNIKQILTNFPKNFSIMCISDSSVTSFREYPQRRMSIKCFVKLCMCRPTSLLLMTILFNPIRSGLFQRANDPGGGGGASTITKTILPIFTIMTVLTILTILQQFQNK